MKAIGLASALSLLLVLSSATASAFALDDLGVVSGDTFELPGYNDGPSGGGVWPGSSGSGGEVGAMPLPNGVPDAGGSPRGGPGGGGGSGSGDGPRVDQTRPPYLSPKNRNTPAARVAYRTSDLSPEDCKAQSATDVQVRQQLVALETAAPDDPTPVAGALERKVITTAAAVERSVLEAQIAGQYYGMVAKHGSRELAERAADQLARMLSTATIGVAHLGDLLGTLTTRTFSVRNSQVCSEDRTRRLARVRVYLVTAEANVVTLTQMHALLEALDDSLYAGPLLNFAEQFVEGAEMLSVRYGEFGMRFLMRFEEDWRDYYRDEIRLLEAACRDTN